MADRAAFAGQWVVLTKEGDVCAVADTADAARHQAAAACPDADALVVWISPHPPHLGLPAWPLLEIRSLLATQKLWLAGGAVRDLLLNRRPTDWDFVTAGSGLMAARAVADALGGAYYALDRERGIGRALVTPPGGETPGTLDFAEMRGATLEDDLRLRDFTIDALAMTLAGQLIDPTGGRRDLQDGRLRMTHPRAFVDDPARLIRAVRLELDLPVTLEPETYRRIEAQGSRVAEVAPERVRAELVKIVGHVSAVQGLNRMSDFGLLDHVLPNVAALGHLRSSWPGVYPTLRNFVFAMVDGVICVERVLRDGAAEAGSPCPPLLADVDAALSAVRAPLRAYLQATVPGRLSRAELVRWAALYLETGAMRGNGKAERGAEIARERLLELRFSRAAAEFVAALVMHADAFDQARSHLLPTPTDAGREGRAAEERRAVYRFYRVTGETGPAAVVMYLARAVAAPSDAPGRRRWHDDLVVARRLLRAYFTRRDELVDPPPLLTGDDLMRLGVPRGPDVGRILEALREKQAAGEVCSAQAARDWVQEQASSL